MKENSKRSDIILVIQNILSQPIPGYLCFREDRLEMADEKKENKRDGREDKGR